MSFGMIPRTGSGIRQVVHFGERSTVRPLLAANLRHHTSDGFRDKAGSTFWGTVHGKATFGSNFEAHAIVTNGTLRHTCATVPQPSELPFGVVRAVGRGIVVLDGVHVRRANLDKSSSRDEIPERDVTYHLICLLIYH